MKLAGLKITIERTTATAYGILALVPITALSGYAVLVRRRHQPVRTLSAILAAGAGVAAYHALTQLVHQLGHALAARATGYPMTGIRYDYAFSYSTYPADEPPVPAAVHIQRSLGGLGGTTVMLMVAVVLWLRRCGQGSWVTRGLLHFVLLDAVLLFVGSLLSDGGFVVQQGWETSEAVDDGQ